MTAGKRDWTQHPATLFKPYRSTVTRAPRRQMLPASLEQAALSGPAYGREIVAELDHDLTRNGAVNGEPLGERIIVSGTVCDERSNPLPNVLIEIWQANAAGRYVHKREIHDAPLDPNFFGSGRTMTDRQGRYRFVTVKPGAYPWNNHYNAWRPAHIHFSLIGANFPQRLVTQMFFPGDPLLAHDPIFNSVSSDRARQLLVAKFDLASTIPEIALGYEFNIVLCGSGATPAAA